MIVRDATPGVLQDFLKANWKVAGSQLFWCYAMSVQFFLVRKNYFHALFFDIFNNIFRGLFVGNYSVYFI